MTLPKIDARGALLISPSHVPLLFRLSNYCCTQTINTSSSRG